MAGGQKFNEFVDTHFTRVGDKNPRTNRWNVKCNYCAPEKILEHRETRCTEHLSKYEKCPNAPESVRREALQQLATKRGVISSTPIDELGTLSNPHVVEDGDNDSIANKKRKVTDSSTTKRKRGAIDTFVDRGFEESAKLEADLTLLRYVYSVAIHVDR